MDLEKEYDNIKFKEVDLLIIGAGGAGLRAAVAASQAGVKVAVISKSLLGKAHTVMAEGGMAASLGNVASEDNWEVHFHDTFKGSGYHGKWRQIEILVKEAPKRAFELEQWGAVWDRTPEGKILQRNFGGHKYPRLVHVGDRTGLEMIRTFEDKVLHEENVKLYMEVTVTKIFTKNGHVTGAFAYSRTKNKIFVFKTKSILMATGGMGKLFRITSNSWECIGSGAALAFNAGVELIDMEFMQFHPTGVAYPSSIEGILVTEGVRGEGGILKNVDGERFMFNYVPEKYLGDYTDDIEEAERWQAGDTTARKPPELLTRDVVSGAIIAEVKAGRGIPTGGVYLDIASRRSREDILKKLPSMHHQFYKLAGFDICKDMMQVAPTAHHAMGGIQINPDDSQSNIGGLFASGEATGGLHGANRLGGNALCDTAVFGARSGEFAAKYVKSVKDDDHEFIPEDEVKAALKDMLSPFDESNTENAFELQKLIQATMSDNLVIRSEESLNAAMEVLLDIEKKIPKCKASGSRIYNSGFHTALDLRDSIITAKMIVHAALLRKESRSAHVRTDYPDTLPEYRRKVFVLFKGKKGEIKVREHENSLLPEHLAKIVPEMEEP